MTSKSTRSASTLARLRISLNGAALVEYVFLAAFISIALLIVVRFLGIQQKDIYEYAGCRVGETVSMSKVMQNGQTIDYAQTTCKPQAEDEITEIVPPDASTVPCDYDALLPGEHCPGVNVFYIGEEIFSDSSTRRMYTYVPGSTDAMIGPIPSDDPVLQWSVVDEMEFNSSPFAQFTNGGPYNSNILNRRGFPYPGANFCAHYGYYLPSQELAFKMYDIRHELQVKYTGYMTSTQHWPLDTTFLLEDNYQWLQFFDDAPPVPSYTFVTGGVYVRCVFDHSYLPGNGPRVWIAPPFDGID